MIKLRILVVDDNEKWREQLPKILKRLGDTVDVDGASNYDLAQQHILDNTYDLAVVDLALRGDPTDPREPDELGMELLKEIRKSPLNRNCGLIMLTGYPSTDRMREAFRECSAHDLVEKLNFDDDAFIEIARAAILKARLCQAKARASARCRLTVKFGKEHLVGSSTMTGHNLYDEDTLDPPSRFDGLDELSFRTDNLNWMILERGEEIWRTEARFIGEAIYKKLFSIRHKLERAETMAGQSDNLWLQFSGPPVWLRVPFELLRDEDDYLCFESILTRRLTQIASRKPGPFYEFIDNLMSSRNTLRVLIVGSNSDGNIPAAEEEARSLERDIGTNLRLLGIAHQITLLSGDDATYANVKDALRDGHYHIFHYAGHGRHNDTLAEISGLILHHDDGSQRTMTASDLKLLASRTNLQMVFLSCCLGARTERNEGYGDFHGTLEALGRADVPIVLGYRWTVADDSAMLMAETFYRTLWRSFFPGEALLEARREIAMAQGRGDETWASPVLLMQNF